MSERTLHKKLAEIMAAVHRIPKRGRNDFHGYNYATEADISECIRGEMAARNVMLIPAVLSEIREKVGEKGSVLTCLEMEMEWVDGDSGESILKKWRGWGTDKEDKGGYKAITGGVKYFLLKEFLIPTGDDPEREETRGAGPKATRSSVAGRVQPAPQLAGAATGAGTPTPLQDVKAEHRRAFALMEQYGWDVSPRGKDERHKLYARATGLTIDSEFKAEMLTAGDWRKVSDLLKAENEPPVQP